MISSGEVFLLNGETGGELRPLPQFVNQNLRVISAGLGRAYVACEPVAAQAESPLPEEARRPLPSRSVYCFNGDSCEPERCPEFDSVEESIKQIAVGEKHILVLAQSGTVYSRGAAIYGNTGHGGAKDVPDFAPVPALRGRRVKFVASGPFFSIAVTHEGDVFAWGQSFAGETGLFSQVDTVPRFAPLLTPFRITAVSCGHSHVLAVTGSQQCIAWGENACGQLGVGQKTKPTYKPQLLESITSKVSAVSAGWAHSVAVGADGRCYSWGLNSHGQLGVGDRDAKIRFSPELLQSLAGSHKVESANAARTFTVFRTTDSRSLLCGQMPRAAHAQDSTAATCQFVPVPLNMAPAHDSNTGTSPSELTEAVAFDRGALGFARSTVYEVWPTVAPVQGGTQVCVKVTGLPFEKGTSSPIQDHIPVRVRLSSSSPLCEQIVSGKIIEVDTIEFTTPDVANSELGKVADGGKVSAVQVQISIDGGLTWTLDRPSLTDASLSVQPQDSVQGGSASTAASVLLWYSRWPTDSPTRVEPACAPVTDGTELLFFTQIPYRMPTDTLTVKFVCVPRSAVTASDTEIKDDGKSPTGSGALESFARGWLDPQGRGVRCVTPQFDPETVKYADYFVELSLDGRKYLDRRLPFQVYDLHVAGLKPNVGPLLEPTTVHIHAEGLVKTAVQKVRLSFPEATGLPPRTLPASYDHTTGEVSFTMPELCAEVRNNIDEQEAALRASKAAAASPPPDTGEQDDVDGGDEGGGEEAADMVIDPSGGLAGLEVVVELTINGQNFTQDLQTFKYHGEILPEAVGFVSHPEGFVEPMKEEGKGKPAKKGAVPDEKPEPVLYPGSKFGCQAKGIIDSEFAVFQAKLVARVGEEEEPFQELTLKAKAELIALPPPPAATEPEPKSKKSAAPAEPIEEVPPVEVMMLTALAPSIPAQDVPEGATLVLVGFEIALDGQHFETCPQDTPLKLEPAPSESSS